MKLLIITLSPVQSFIESSRKVRDLYAASAIISELMKELCSKINNFGQIVYPFLNPKLKMDSIPNRIVALIENEVIEKNYFEELVFEKLGEIVKKSFKNIEDKIEDSQNITDNLNEYLNKDIIKKQIQSAFKIDYVVVDSKNYGEAFTKASRFLGAIKKSGNVNPFQEESERKCSLCGIRNVVVCRQKYKKNLINKNEKIFLNNNSTQISEHEGLCSVCAVKRFYKSNIYYSTAYYAIKDWWDKAQANQKKKKQIDDFKNKCQTQLKGFDHQLFFKENLNEEYLDKYYYTSEIENLQIFKEELRDDIKKIISKSNLSPYYAVIYYDGDSIGSFLNKIIASTNEKHTQHEKFSEELGKLANEMKKITDKHGDTIYAGGDDFLGIVKIQEIFELLKNIEIEFSTFNSDHHIKENITFSCSIVFAHYKTPLDKVLRYVRKGMDEIKSKYSHNPSFNTENKNGVALTWITHSNKVIKASLKKRDFLANVKTANTQSNKPIKFYDLVLELKNKSFSTSFIRKLAKEMSSFEFENIHFDNFIKVKAILETNLKRLLKNSSNKENNQSFEKVYKYLLELIEAQIVENKHSHNSLNFHNFINLLLIGEKLQEYI